MGTTKQRPAIIIPPDPSLSAPATPRSQRRGPRILTALLSALALIALLHFLAVTHLSFTAASPSSCQELLHNTDYTKFIALRSKTQEVGALQPVDQLTGGQPAVLVPVSDTGSQHLLDVYIFVCMMQQQQPKLALRFVQQGLVQGTVSISSANTLLISQLDPTITPEASVLMLPLQQNIYREYRWHNGAFIQVQFPGLYPVSSRGQAEALQDQANNGQSLLWSDPVATVQQMARDLFQWDTSQVIDQSNDGTTAHVLLTHQNPHLEVNVTLSRLLQHDNKGLWFVTKAQTSAITLAPSQLQVTASTITFRGNGMSGNGQSTVSLFDHTLMPIPLSQHSTLQVSQDGTFTGTLFYSSITSEQPGLLLIENIPSANGTPGQLLLTGVLLDQTAQAVP
ncbi:MAG TPA: hypothetical protein VKY19_28545 [Ktedonosporobacter sp.]|nr:hypothetical protein [Ktedonosporobacter sp.]